MRPAVLAGLMLLGACNLADRQRDAGANNMQSPANEAGARGARAANSAGRVEDGGNAQLASAPPPRRDPSGVDRQWFAGFWTDTGDCADAGQFGADGRYRLADGTRGMWNVQDGRLVIQNDGGRRLLRIRKVAENMVETTTGDGQASRSTRCARVTPRAEPKAEPVEPPDPDMVD